MGKLAFRQHISVFFLGEYFSDAVRNTLSVVLPIAFFFYFGKPETATGIGVGALLISLTDLPDHRRNKIRSAIYSIILFFLSSLLIAGSLSFPILSAIILIVLAFVFSMFNGLGNRMGLIGTMCLALCTFTMGLRPSHPLQFSGYVFIGGCWYYALSILQVLLRPYRSLHHAIFECLISSAAFLRSRAAHYDPDVPLHTLQADAIRLHIRVNQRHELMRQLLLTDRLAMNPENKKGQIFLHRAALVISLYEQLSAVNYQYEFVRSTLGGTGSLMVIGQLIDHLSLALEELSRNFRRPDQSKVKAFLDNYEHLKESLYERQPDLSSIQHNVLSSILSNADAIASIIAQLQGNLLKTDQPVQIREEIAYPLFVTAQSGSIWQQFSFSSPIFRFSIRLALSFLFAYLLLVFFEPGRYSYWIFLTILIVSRPRFSLTWKRNIQRILGTLPGVVLGLVIIYLIKSPVVLLSLSVIFLLGFYAFNRLNYALCVGFITAAVILTLGSYHGEFDHIIRERIIYTLLGCSIAVLATYLFPVWDSRKLENYIMNAISACHQYLNVALERSSKGNVDETASRMARKNAHLSLVELSDAIGAAKLEPVSKSVHFEKLNDIQFSIYQISALITAIYLTEEQNADLTPYPAIDHLFEQLKQLPESGIQDDVMFIPSSDLAISNGKSSIRHKLDEILLLTKEMLHQLKAFQSYLVKK